MWKGRIFHSLIAKYLHRTHNDDKTATKSSLTAYSQSMKNQWNASVKFADKWNCSSKCANDIEKHGFIILEHFYQEVISENALNDAIQDIRNWGWRFIRWFREEGIQNTIHRCSDIWIEPPMRGPNATVFKIGGDQVITKVDLALKNPEEQFEIFDWKTSAPVTQVVWQHTQPEFQATVYQLWPHLKLNHPIDRINTRVVYFGSESTEESSTSLNENLKEYGLSLIRRSISKMRYFDQIHHDRFQSTLDGLSHLTLNDLDFAHGEKTCFYCPFKHLCRRELGI